jgi:hypothetical protein
MPVPRFGKLPPRYRFALNPFPEVRWARCPRCEKLMHARKFPLLIAWLDGTMLVLGYTCRYCTPCEFIIAHQHEVEEEIAIFRAAHPGTANGEYGVIATVERKTWKASLAKPLEMREVFDHASDIKHPMELNDPRRVWVLAAPPRTGG